MGGGRMVTIHIGVPELRIAMHRLTGTNLVADVEINGLDVKARAWRLYFRNSGKGGQMEDLRYVVMAQAAGV
jgi:hypothetical protein